MVSIVLGVYSIKFWDIRDLRIGEGIRIFGRDIERLFRGIVGVRELNFLEGNGVKSGRRGWFVILNVGVGYRR